MKLSRAMQHTPLVWSDALSLAMPVMDTTHEEFVELLAKVDASPDNALLHHWQALVTHTDDHFRREDEWMTATGFAAGNCHSTQHSVVLKVLREGTTRGQAGDLGVIRQIARELALWFPQHAQSMDAGLALHLKSMGYDPVTGQLSDPSRLPEQAITGCGGSTCHPADDQQAA
jgi:hemerythrin-like metal-binding protein